MKSIARKKKAKKIYRSIAEIPVYYTYPLGFDDSWCTQYRPSPDWLSKWRGIINGETGVISAWCSWFWCILWCEIHLSSANHFKSDHKILFARLFFFFFLSNSQNIKYCSVSAEHIFVQYHYRLRGLQLCILVPTKDTGVSAAWYGAQSHSHSLDLGCPSSIPFVEEYLAALYASPRSVEAFPFRPRTLCSRWKLFKGVECHWWNWREIWQPFLPHSDSHILLSGCWKRFNTLQEAFPVC